MSMNAATRTATILSFPNGGRFRPSGHGGDDRPTVRPVVVEAGSGAWYHEEAIREAEPESTA